MTAFAKLACALFLTTALAAPAMAAEGDAGSGPTMGATPKNDAGSGPTKGYGSSGTANQKPSSSALGKTGSPDNGAATGAQQNNPKP